MILKHILYTSTYIQLLISIGINNADKYLQISFGDGFLLYSELEILHFPVKKIYEVFHRKSKQQRIIKVQVCW